MEDPVYRNVHLPAGRGVDMEAASAVIKAHAGNQFLTFEKQDCLCFAH